MKVEIDQVYSIKISNGDEIVAKIIEETADYYTVQRPLVIIPSQQGIQMLNALFTAHPDKSVTINKRQVSMISMARDEVRDSHIEATTGIKPVSNKILMG